MAKMHDATDQTILGNPMELLILLEFYRFLHKTLSAAAKLRNMTNYKIFRI